MLLNVSTTQLYFNNVARIKYQKNRRVFQKMQDYKLVTDTPTPFMTIGCSGRTCLAMLQNLFYHHCFSYS